MKTLSFNKISAISKGVIIMLFAVSAGFSQYDLASLVELAKKENITLKKESHSKTRSDIAVKQAHNDFLPDLNANISNSYSIVNSGKFANDYSIGASLSSSINLFNGFSDMNNLKKAQLLRESSEASYDWKVESIAYETANYYFNILKSQKEIELANDNLKRDEELLEIVEKKVAVGSRTKMDLLEQKAKTQSSLQSVLLAKRDLLNNQLTLKKLIDIKANEELDVLKIEGSSLVAKIQVDESVNKDLAAIQKDRNDIKTQANALEVAEKNYEIAASGYWPKLSLSLGISDGYSSADTLGWSNQWNKDRLNSSIGLSLNIPIFDRFSTKNKRADAREVISIEELNLEELNKSIDYENVEALQYLSVALEQLSLAKSQLEFAEESWNFKKASYENGIITNSEMNLSTNALLQAQSNLIETEYEIIIRWLELKYLQGEILTAINFGS